MLERGSRRDRFKGLLEGIIEDAINDMDRVMFVAPEPVTYDEFLEEAPEKPTLVPTMFVKEKSILDEDWMQFAWPNSRI